jgi:sugar/nucleoside kinase (ribokinase family)
MLDLVAVGDVMLDVHLPAAGGARAHGAIATAAGGSAVNAARATVRLGASAAVVGAVGDDPVGRVIELELAASGVEAHPSRFPARAREWSSTAPAPSSRTAGRTPASPRRSSPRGG